MKGKVLITGGAGFIGSVISSYLSDNGYELAVVDDLSTGHKEVVDKRATFYQGSILDKSFLINALDGIDKDGSSWLFLSDVVDASESVLLLLLGKL